MKKSLLAVGLLAAAVVNAAQFHFAENGKTNYSIVVPDQSKNDADGLDSDMNRGESCIVRNGKKAQTIQILNETSSGISRKAAEIT